MPKIKFLPHVEICPEGIEIEAESGESVCEAALRNGLHIEHACEMSCACTTCHVHVREGYESLDEAEGIISDAIAVQKAGAFAVVLEGIPSELAEKITKLLSIPTIGIGAGPHCDGQIQVFHDILGLFDEFVPKHAKQFSNISNHISKAIEQYKNDVVSGEFPTKDNCISMDKKIFEKL